MPSSKLGSSEYVIAAQAIKLMGVSRHAFEKLVKKGILTQDKAGDKTVYSMNDINAFMQTKEYKDLV